METEKEIEYKSTIMEMRNFYKKSRTSNWRIDVEALKEQVPVLSVSYILFYSCNSIITHVLSKQGWAIC